MKSVRSRLTSHRGPVAWLALAALWACGPRDAAPPAGGSPDIQTREVTYREGAAELRGLVAWDAARDGRRPGVLVVHEWWGHNEHARAQARRLAEAGYVGFALDMFGDGKSTSHPDSAQAFVAEAMSDLSRLRARFDAAWQELLRDPNVDSTQIAAIGYCFGGAVVLDRARAGTDLDAVVSFHGALVPGPVDSGSVKARVLVLTGADDPMVPDSAVDRFRREMTAAGADFEIVSYPGVRHSFTNPRADSVGMDGLAYDAAADRQSWDAMLRLFADVFR
jgi:dienelactone hydrolase